MGSMEPDHGREIVHKNTGEIPSEEILCTTYQQRNFYKQMRDGFFTKLTVMNYILHFAIAGWLNDDDVVVDACCGRGLMLPLLRRSSANISSYTGVEIEKDNLTPRDELVNEPRSIEDVQVSADTHEEYYDFDLEYIVDDVANMGDHIENNSVDSVVYTSSIEHMHPNHGKQSLDACAEILKPGGTLYLSCPRTPEGDSGYDVQYKAHVYEWKLSELRDELKVRGFRIREEYGLSGSIQELRSTAPSSTVRSYIDSITEFIPVDFATPVLFAPYPERADEVLLIAERIEGESAGKTEW